jgi:hypothetical protein
MLEMTVNREGVKGMRKSQNLRRWSVDRDSNPGLPEYEQD